MKTTHINYFHLLTGLILLTLVFIPACTQSTQTIDGGENQTASEEFTAAHKEITEHLDRFEDLAVVLKDFKWKKLSDIGYQIYPNACGTSLVKKHQAQTTGGFKWLSLVDTLPRAENADPVLAYCEICMASLDDMMTEPAHSAVQAAGQETAPAMSLQEQCNRLESTLNGAASLIKNYLKTAHNQFIDIEEKIIKSGGDIEKDYSTTFHTQAQTYLDLLETMLDTIDRAKQATATLSQLEKG